MKKQLLVFTFAEWNRFICGYRRDDCSSDSLDMISSFRFVLFHFFESLFFFFFFIEKKNKRKHPMYAFKSQCKYCTMGCKSIVVQLIRKKFWHSLFINAVYIGISFHWSKSIYLSAQRKKKKRQHELNKRWSSRNQLNTWIKFEESNNSLYQTEKSSVMIWSSRY